MWGEYYPYDAASTSIGSEFLTPQGMKSIGLEYKDAMYDPEQDKMLDQAGYQRVRPRRRLRLSNYELLKLATSQNAEYFALSGERHPYKEGPLGVIKGGAYADILLVDGNPLDDVSVLGDDGKNIALIMKDGRIYKNALR